MTQELKEKLKTEIDFADWKMLEGHQEKHGVLLIDSKLNLIDAGVAIAQDEVVLVKSWQEEALLGRPTNEQIKDWKKSPNEKNFKFIIVQPFVLIQLIQNN
jgi:hypothetical protein